MKVALVHDYLNEFGGAERVLLALAEMYPEAPIYTAFYREGSLAYERFKHRDIRPSWAQKVPWFASKLHSPLRFLAPEVWESFDLDEYDVVISSASWYITKGVITRPETLHICYCHTPPRYLYGYQTSIEWQKYWLVRQYARVVNHYLRKYDFAAAQRVDVFVANSKNVQRRIQKFYRRDSVVIYPPVDIHPKSKIKNSKKRDYYLVVSRMVGGKGLQLAVEAATRLHVPMKVVGVAAGWSREQEKIGNLAGSSVEFLGYVEDDELWNIYAGAKAFVTLAKDEDFGITPVEAMAAGTPVLAYRGGGYMETVVEGKTGVLVDELTVEAVIKGMKQIQDSRFKMQNLRRQAKKFSKQRFVEEMGNLVEKEYRKRA